MDSSLLRISVAIACFNRREQTLECLRSLFGQSHGNANISVHLFDDASDDGTADAVRQNFPNVRIIEGNGESYWGGGMFLAMQSAVVEPYDFVLWLNDDVELRADALEKLCAAYELAKSQNGTLCAIVGAVEDPHTGKISYSGFSLLYPWHPCRLEQVLPDPARLVQCDAMNGNCVLIPKEVVEKAGLIDPSFIHQLGDIDYGYRVRKQGGRLWIASDVVGYCLLNERPKIWLKKSLNFRERWKNIFHPLGLPWKSWSVFLFRHSPILAPFFLVSIYARAIFNLERQQR